MKHIIPLTALLLTGLLLLSGCGPTNPEVLPNIPMEACPAPTILEALELSETDVEGLDSMFETLDLSDEKEGVTLRVLESCGDGQLLYVLLSLTLPGDMNPDKSELAKIWSKPIFLAGDASMGTGPLRYDPDTRQIYFLSEIAFSAPGYTGQPVRYEIQSLEYLGLDDQDSLSVEWSPKNQAPQRSAQNKYGTCTMTPLSMNIELLVDAEGIGAEVEENHILSDYIETRYQDGTVVQGVRYGGDGTGPVRLYAMRPPYETLFHLQKLESVTLFDCVFAFPQG